jgi:hypothetical protein
MTEAAPEDENLRSGATTEAHFEGKESRLTRQLLQLLLQGLVLGLACTILRQQFVEDAGPKLINTLRKIEKRFLARLSSKLAAITATSKLRG